MIVWFHTHTYTHKPINSLPPYAREIMCQQKNFRFLFSSGKQFQCFIMHELVEYRMHNFHIDKCTRVNYLFNDLVYAANLL